MSTAGLMKGHPRKRKVEMSLEAWGDENPADADYDSWADRAMDAGWIDPADYSPGVMAILRERERQEVDEGWSPEHDDEHADGELAKAAGCYAWLAAQSDGLREAFATPPPTWPEDWAVEWWKPKDRRADLVRAGALIAAEIDRLDRASKREDTR